jgi:hypothetical protein
VTAAEPARRRRRWPWVLLIALVVLALAVVFGGDAIARPLGAQFVAQRIGGALGVDPDELDVSFAATPLPIQLLDGRIDSVDVTAPQLSLGPVTADVTVHAEGIPLDQDAATDRLRIRVAIDQDHVEQLARTFAGGYVQSATLKKPDVLATGRITVLGVPLDLGVGLKPGAVDGRLAFTPTSVRIAGQTLTAEQLRSNPATRGIADALLKRQTVCIADHLPKAVTVTRVEVSGEDLVATATGDGAVLGDLGTKGSCG